MEIRIIRKKVLSKLKRSPFVSWIYKYPWLLGAYHLAFAFLGSVAYRRPSREIKVIGITGTKGKTTALEILNSIFEAAGEKTALLSSVRVKIGENFKKNLTENSMPGRMFIQRFLRKAVGAGCGWAFVEATSQGAIAYRHWFIGWAGAGLTNVHPEHVEAHGSYEKYRDAKLSFLSYAGTSGAPVFINGDDKEASFFEMELKGSKIKIYSAGGIPALSPRTKEVLPGEFNRQNIALAIAIAKEFGISEEIIKKGLENFKGVPGRVEFVQKEPFRVVVDYAHTAESLGAIYKTMKESAGGKEESFAGASLGKTRDGQGKLICILGSAGGGRDRWKRPAMGSVAGKYCDTIILTNEDPYDEDPADIVAEVKSGVLVSGFPEEKLFEILDRREAIKKAVEFVRPGDTIISTGKGSESWIHAGKGEKIPWNEREVFEEELKNKEPR